MEQLLGTRDGGHTGVLDGILVDVHADEPMASGRLQKKKKQRPDISHLPTIVVKRDHCTALPGRAAPEHDFNQFCGGVRAKM